MTGPGKIGLDDPRWLAPLFRHAIASGGTPGLAAERDGQVLLWSTGVLLGAGKTPPLLELKSDAEAAFVQLVTLELGRAVALLRPHYPDNPAHLRWALGSLLAASYEEYGISNVYEEALQGEALSEGEEGRLLEVIAAQARRHAYLQGNPADGLPLHAGIAAIEARAFVRSVAASRRGGHLRQRAEAYRRRTSRLKALLIELVAGVFEALDADQARTAARQVRGVFLLPGDRRAALAALRAPRAPGVVLRDVPRPTRRLLVEQTVLAALLVNRWSPPLKARLEAIPMPASDLASMEARAAAFLVEHQESALALARPGHLTAMDAMLRQANDSLQEAAAAVAQEIRETGELGALLARMARGETLSPDERLQMRAQLIDLAKVVPSLAIFAAPGGMLLLPLVLKFLPFDLRPSAFQNRPSAPPPARPSKSTAP